jgi:hypothetical protein
MNNPTSNFFSITLSTVALGIAAVAIILAAPSIIYNAVQLIAA